MAAAVWPTALVDPGRPVHQPRAAHRVAGQQPPRVSEGVHRGAHLPGTRQRVAELLPRRGHLLRWDLRAAGGVDRAPVEVGSGGERRVAARAVAGFASVDPGLRVLAGAMEVQREQAADLLQHRAVLALHPLADRPMQAPARAVRQAAVGGVADDGAAEAQVAVAVVLEERLEPHPCLLVGWRHVIAEHVEQEARVEADAEHRGAADDRALLRGESIDARHRGGLEAVRQLVAPPDAAARSRSRRNCGLPPERSTARSSSVGLSGAASVAASASARACGASSGPGSIRMTSGPPVPRTGRLRGAAGGRTTGLRRPPARRRRTGRRRPRRGTARRRTGSASAA